MDFREYARAFEDVRADFEASVASFGLPFEEGGGLDRSRRRLVAEQCAGCSLENAGASLRRGWVSPACVACRTGVRSATFTISLKCTRDCYFCFNKNQDNYEHDRSHVRDAARELECAHAAGAQFDCLALTGGEPLLHKPQTLAFFQCAKRLYPHAHTRLYTCGDLLDAECLAQLAQAGLREIRFSVKPDAAGGSEGLFASMEKAVSAIPDVVVEMPVIPRTDRHRPIDMEELLLRLDAMGVRGINLLEFCFPLNNAEAFARRGFSLRKRPYDVLYNYWYAGGLPVAGSEEECLHLMAFAAERGLRLGVHYCSADNKNTGQIYQQNLPFLQDAELARRLPWLCFDQTDFFLKSAKAFGQDAAPVAAWLRERGVAASIDESIPLVEFPLESAFAVQGAFPRAELARSWNVLEPEEGAGSDASPAFRVRELKVERI